MHRPIKYVEKILAKTAGAAFNTIQFFSDSENPSFTPRWSNKPLQKSHQKTKPPLGWPRETDSLCPKCIIEARKRMLQGEEDYGVLAEQVSVRSKPPSESETVRSGWRKSVQSMANSKISCPWIRIFSNVSKAYTLGAILRRITIRACTTTVQVP
jgi:hypothetical protein